MLPPNSLVLSGSQIFNIFFEGTKFLENHKNGSVTTFNLAADWPGVELVLKSALQDITAINSGSTSGLEGWFEILSKIMKMWQTSSENLNVV